MILCCAHCEEPIPERRAGSMFCSIRCASAYEAEMKADFGMDDPDYGRWE